MSGAEPRGAQSAPRIDGSADAAKWHLAFLLLGLDRATPFLRDMGLEVNAGHALREIARAYVRAHRVIENELGRSPTERLAAYQSLLDHALERIGAELGGSSARAVAEWGRSFPYETPSAGRAVVWARLLRRLAGISALGHPAARLSLPQAKREVVIRAVRKHLGDPSGLDAQLRAAAREKPSEWERLIDETYTGGDPLDWVHAAVEYQKTVAAWREISALLDPDDRHELQRWAVEQARLLEMKGVDVEPFEENAGG